MSNAHFIQDLDKGILGKQDSTEMWEEILSNIPKEDLVYRNQKFLFPAIGQRTEVQVMAKILLSLGWTSTQIKENFYLVDKYSMFTNPAKEKGFKNVHTGDFLTWKTDMKFDVVIGNPPYRKGLWRKFLTKSFELCNGIIGLVTPDSSGNETAQGKTDRAMYLSKGIQYKQDCRSYFKDVSTGSISYFIFNRTKEGKAKLFEDTSVLGNIKRKVLLPEDQQQDILFEHGNISTGKNGKLEKLSITDTQDSNHIYPVVIRITKNGRETKFSDQKIRTFRQKNVSKMTGSGFIHNLYLGKNKEISVYKIDKIEDVMYSSNIQIHKCDVNDTEESFKSLYGSKLYRVLLEDGRVRANCNWTRSNCIEPLPKLNLTKSWTDAELYAHFNLTQEEIDYIEATVK